jgi:hypothetical protein
MAASRSLKYHLRNRVWFPRLSTLVSVTSQPSNDLVIVYEGMVSVYSSVYQSMAFTTFAGQNSLVFFATYPK